MTDLKSQHNRFVWADIPVADLDRAIVFYEGVLGVPCHRESFEGWHFAVIDHKDGNGGTLVPTPDEIGDKGPTVYLNCDGRIRDAAAKAAQLGGEIIKGIHAIGPHGFRAVVKDSEGNRIALHSNTDA